MARRANAYLVAPQPHQEIAFWLEQQLIRDYSVWSGVGAGRYFCRGRCAGVWYLTTRKWNDRAGPSLTVALAPAPGGGTAITLEFAPHGATQQGYNAVALVWIGFVVVIGGVAQMTLAGGPTLASVLIFAALGALLVGIWLAVRAIADLGVRRAARREATHFCTVLNARYDREPRAPSRVR